MGLVGRMAAFTRRVFPEGFLRKIDRKLESTKIALSAEEYVGIALLATVVVGVAFGLFGMLLPLPLPAPLLALPVALPVFPALTLGVPSYLAQRRAAELERELPDALRQIASTLRAGVGVDAAMDDIVKSKYGVLSEEFNRVLTEMRRGRTLESALLALARRSNSLLFERAFRLIVEGIERGAALSSVLDAVSTDAREVYSIQRERQAATMQQVSFLLAVALFAAPFIVGLTVAVSGIGTGGIGRAAALPGGMGTIALLYVVIQALICASAVGVIRYGRMSKGLTFAVPFMVAAGVVFYIAKILAGWVAPV